MVFGWIQGCAEYISTLADAANSTLDLRDRFSRKKDEVPQPPPPPPPPPAPSIPNIQLEIREPPPHALFKHIDSGEKLGLGAFDGLYGLDMQRNAVMKYSWVFDRDKFGPYCKEIAGDIPPKPPFLLFSGPPGSGKTETASRTAKAFGVPLLNVEAAHVRGDANEGTAARLQKLALQIQKVKSCVVLFDEIDHFIARDGEHADPEAASNRSQFRQLVDGPDHYFKESNVIFIGSTNQLHRIEEDMLSRAEVVQFDLPNTSTTSQIIKHRARHLGDTDILELARIANQSFLSPRDINQCARIALLEAWSASGQEQAQKPTEELYRMCYRRSAKKYRFQSMSNHDLRYNFLESSIGKYTWPFIAGGVFGASLKVILHGLRVR